MAKTLLSGQLSANCALGKRRVMDVDVIIARLGRDLHRQVLVDGHACFGWHTGRQNHHRRPRHTFRAATQSLIAEGLLRREPNRGVQLAVLDSDDIIDIFKLRAALELEAVRLVVTDERPLDAAARAVDVLN